MKNLRRKHPQIQEKTRCRCNLNMIGRLKIICKLKEKQVADTLVPKRVSATVNIKVVQIHQSKKEHLQQRISSFADTSAA